MKRFFPVLLLALAIAAVSMPALAGISGPSGGAAGFPTGHISGLRVDADGDSSITVQIGSARSKDDDTDLSTTAIITSLDPFQPFDADNGGGLDVGCEAGSTWYYVHSINDTDAVLVSLSLSSPTLPGGITDTRLIAPIRNDGSSNLLRGRQDSGGERRLFRFNESTVDNRTLTGGSATAFTAVDCSAFVPPNNTGARLRAFHATTAAGMRVRFPSGGGGLIDTLGATGDTRMELAFTVDLDDSQNIDYQMLAGGAAGFVEMLGYLFDADGSE